MALFMKSKFVNQKREPPVHLKEYILVEAMTKIFTMKD